MVDNSGRFLLLIFYEIVFVDNLVKNRISDGKVKSYLFKARK